jgi:hypothetical protein
LTRKKTKRTQTQQKKIENTGHKSIQERNAKHFSPYDTPHKHKATLSFETKLFSLFFTWAKAKTTLY